MNFMFELVAREHKIHIFELTDDGVYDDFSMISDHFLKISELVRSLHEHLRTTFS